MLIQTLNVNSSFPGVEPFTLLYPCPSTKSSKTLKPLEMKKRKEKVKTKKEKAKKRKENNIKEKNKK